MSPSSEKAVMWVSYKRLLGANVIAVCFPLINGPQWSRIGIVALPRTGWRWKS